MKYFTGVVLGVLLGACAAPTVTSMVAEGGEVTEGGIGSLIGDDGVTLTAVDDSWIAYLSADGRKEIYIKSQDLRESLTWRRTDDGTFCEMMYKPREEKCYSDNMELVKSVSEIYSVFTDGQKGKYPFKVAIGNTNEF